MGKAKRAGNPGATGRSILPSKPPKSSPKQGFSPSRRQRLPLLELQALQRDAATNGWTPEAYLRIARWCHRHRPQTTGLWLRLALEVA
jgi:hypothetical protein